MRRGIFISLEGIDGAGKSTLTQFLKSKMSNLRIYRFPSYEGYGKQAREMLKSNELDHTKYMMLCMMDMYEIYNKQIAPDLSNGISVVCDRFIHSLFAYQSVLLKKSKNLSIKSISFWVYRTLSLPNPDITLLLDIPVEEAMRRVATVKNLKNSSEKSQKFSDNIEKNTSRSMYNAIRKQYVYMIGKEKYGNIHLIDATLPMKNLMKQVILSLKSCVQIK